MNHLMLHTFISEEIIMAMVVVAMFIVIVILALGRYFLAVILSAVAEAKEEHELLQKDNVLLESHDTDPN